MYTSKDYSLAASAFLIIDTRARRGEGVILIRYVYTPNLSTFLSQLEPERLL